MVNLCRYNLLSTWAALLRKVNGSHWLDFETSLHSIYRPIIWCNVSWCLPNFGNDTQTIFSKWLSLGIWPFSIIHSSIDLGCLSFQGFIFFSEEPPHVLVDLNSLIGSISHHRPHLYKQNQSVPLVEITDIVHSQLYSTYLQSFSI